jgi:DNA-binding transcriptional ArsR family regulator
MAATASAVDSELERLFETVSGYFAVLAEPTRLKILSALCDGERSVGEIVQRVASTQINVSRHLNLMYLGGVLTRRREESMTLYAVADANVVALCRSACTHSAGLAEDQTMGSRALRRFMPKH